MKKSIYKITFFLALLLVVACKKEKPQVNPTEPIGKIIYNLNVPNISSLEVMEHYCYVATKNVYKEFYVFDVSNPFNVESVYGNLMYKTEKVFIHNNKLFFANGNEGAAVYSLSDPEKPEKLFTISYGNFVNDIFANDQYIYLAGVKDSANGFVSIQNVLDGSLVGSFIQNNEEYLSVYVSGNYLFAGTKSGRLHIINITDPSSPYKVGEYVLSGNYFTPYFINKIYVHENKAYLACGCAGFRVLDVSNVSSPQLLAAHYSTTNDAYIAYDFEIVNNIAYVANGWAVTVINISNPSSLTAIQEFKLPGLYIDIEIWNDYALLANVLSGRFEIIKVK